LDPEDIKVLGKGTICNFAKGASLEKSSTGYGHKGPVLIPRCIGPERAQTRTLFYFITSLLPANFWPCKCCFIGPNKWKSMAPSPDCIVDVSTPQIL
jgi:hypothetical protein